MKGDVTKRVVWDEKEGKESIYTIRFFKEGERPRGILFFIHGLGEHSGRYHDMASFIVKNTDVVVGLVDLPGHGKTEEKNNGTKGHLGYEWILRKRLISIICDLQWDYGDSIPVFIGGFSMGAIFATDIVRRGSIKNGNNLISVGGAYKNSGVMSKVDQLKYLWYSVFFPRKYTKSLININDLVKDPKVLRSMLMDPYGHGLSTFGSVSSIYLSSIYCNNISFRRGINAYLAYGNQDRLINTKQINTIGDKILKNKGEVHYNIIDMGYHCVLIDKGNDMLLTDISNWINRSINK